MRSSICEANTVVLISIAVDKDTANAKMDICFFK